MGGLFDDLSSVIVLLLLLFSIATNSAIPRSLTVNGLKKKVNSKAVMIVRNLISSILFLLSCKMGSSGLVAASLWPYGLMG